MYQIAGKMITLSRRNVSSIIPPDVPGLHQEIKITSPSATDRTYLFILLIFILLVEYIVSFFSFFFLKGEYTGNETLIPPRNADKTGIVVVRNDVRVAGGVANWLKKKLFVHAVGVYRKVIGYRTSRGRNMHNEHRC